MVSHSLDQLLFLNTPLVLLLLIFLAVVTQFHLKNKIFLFYGRNRFSGWGLLQLPARIVERIWKLSFFLPLPSRILVCFFYRSLSALLGISWFFRCWFIPSMIFSVCTLLFASLRAPSHLALTTATSFHLLLLFASLTILLMQIGLMFGVPNCFLLHLEKNQIPYCDVCCASAQWSLLLFISPMQFLSTNLNRCSPSPKHILPTKGQWLLRPSFPSDCCYLWNGLA